MRINTDQLCNVTEKFYKLAQDVSADYSLVDSIRRNLGDKITQDAGQFLNSKAVSSIPIRIDWKKPTAAFVVDSTGTDKATVDSELKALLDKKYSKMVAGMLMKAQSPAFQFGLLTVE